jgi:3-methylcrotonyl-CoA carboxylase alpha subunit
MSSCEFLFNGDVVASVLEKEGENLKVKVGEKEFEFRSIGNNLFSTTVNGANTYIAVVKHKGVYYIDINSVLLEVQETSEDMYAGGAGDAIGEKDKIFAPMPGKIVKIMVKVDDQVDEKQPLVIVEAMKMEHQVNSGAGGRVKAINFAQGDQVDTETPIIELELRE